MGMLDVFSNRNWQHLIAALLHTLWQGAILGGLLSIALRRLPASRHDARYVLALAAQFGVLLSGLATWSLLDYEPTRPAPASAAAITRSRAVAGPDQPIATVPVGAAVSHAVHRNPDWTSILAIAWLAGVAMMLGRTIGSVWTAARLARGPRVGDSAILAMVGRIRDELGLLRPIRVVEAPEDCGPAVLGVVWPTLLLPASAMTGLPSDMLRAILIHELAHIRRHDYLVNLTQMVVESVLFFNPAVWWLGRQARLEREACCDAAAVRLTGRPLDYSRSLAEWARRSRGVAVAAAWDGDRRPGTLLERVRRVLRPGDRPAARVSPSGLILLLIGGPMLLALLWRGTTAAVVLAAQILSPAERIERVQAAQAEYAPPAAEVAGKGTLKGTILKPDGRPLDKAVWLDHSTRLPNGSGHMGLLGHFRAAFSAEVPAGTTWLSLETDDYAPAMVGPIAVRAGQTVEGISIRLESGFPSRIVVTDGAGHPVPGAVVSAHRLIEDGSSVGHFNGRTTDRDGVATIPHAVAAPYNVSVEAHGYEPLSRVKATPSPREPIALKVRRAQPVRGVAIDPGGKPVAGAEVRVSFEEAPNSGFDHGLVGPVLATTDREGRFLLDTLKSGTTYSLYLAETSKTGMHGFISGVVAGRLPDLRVTLSPKLGIKGTIKAGGAAAMPASVNVIQLIRTDRGATRTRNFNRSAWVDKQGHFAATDLFPGETRIEAAGRTHTVQLDGPETPVTIDLTRPTSASQWPMRRVVLRVTTPDGAVAPSGKIEVIATRPDDRGPTPQIELTLERGRASLDAPVPGRVSYQSRSMVGYWFMDGSVEVHPGEGEQVVEIPSMPAGAIVGQVFDADGRPAAGGVNISCQTVERAVGPLGQISITRGFPVDAQGRFFASPLPLGGSYAVIAGRGHNRRVAPTVRLDGANPTGRVTVRLDRDAAAEGRVVGPDGRPLAGVPVVLRFVRPTAQMSWSPPTRTDDAGRFRFDDLSPDADAYRAAVEATEAYQPGEAVLRPGGPPAEVRLQRGHVLEGRVLDAKTGWPIPGVDVYAHRVDWTPGERYAYEAEGKTDDQGRFRFSNLPEGAWILGDRNGLEWASPHQSHAFAVDGPDPVEIRGNLPAWSDLKPREPKGR